MIDLNIDNTTLCVLVYNTVIWFAQKLNIHSENDIKKKYFIILGFNDNYLNKTSVF